MNDNVSDIQDYYNREVDQEQTRLERHLLEYELTWRYLERYLPPSGSILEIGAATGKYTVALARRGYALTAVDLSPVLLERCQQNLRQAGLEGQVTLVLADARDLSALAGADFDAVLLMGPLYHLVLETDRHTALLQATRRLQKGGVLFSSFISRYGILGDLMRNVPEWIEEREEVRSVLARGRDPEDYPPGGFRGYFARADEIPPLHAAAGLEMLALAGVEPAISADDESYNRLEGSHRTRWLDLLEAVSQEPSILGASRHLLYVGRKP
jgi:SAM-dependent methyltransferase